MRINQTSVTEDLHRVMQNSFAGFQKYVSAIAW